MALPLSACNNNSSSNSSPPATRSTTPTQSTTSNPNPNPNPNAQIHNPSLSATTTTTTTMRPSASQSQIQAASIHAFASPEQPYLQALPPFLSPSLSDLSRPPSSPSHSSEKERQQGRSSSGGQSRQGSASDLYPSSASSSGSSSAAPPSTLSWLSLALFSDEPDDDDDDEEEAEEEQARDRAQGSNGNRRIGTRSPTPDLEDHSSSESSAIDSSTESSSVTSATSSSSSFQSRRLHRGLYSPSNSSSPRSRSSSKEGAGGAGQNKKTRRSASMMSPGSSSIEKSRFTSSLYSRPEAGANQTSSPLQPSIDLSRTGSFSSSSSSSRRKPSYSPRHSHSRSTSSSDSFNINIPPSSRAELNELNPPTSPRWSTHARRLSSSLSKSASPYLKAGLDELRDIFDVESERDGWREEEWSREKDKKLEEAVSRHSILPLVSNRQPGSIGDGGGTDEGKGISRIISESGRRSRHRSRPSTAPTWSETTPSSPPMASSSSSVNQTIIAASSSPNLDLIAKGTSSSALSRNHSHNDRGSNRLLSPTNAISSSSPSNRQARERQSSAPPSFLKDGPSPSSFNSTQSSSSSDQPFTERLFHPGSPSMSRTGSDHQPTTEKRGITTSSSPALAVDLGTSEKEIGRVVDIMARRRVGLGLVLLGVGVFGIEAFEYVRDPNAISPHLIAFFSIQSLFAFIGFFSLLAYKLPIMDLASRGIRAHVLAQLFVALMAMKELASTARYGESSKNEHSSEFISSSPTSSLKFGKLFQSAQDRARHVMSSTYRSSSSSVKVNHMIRSYTESEAASHAHETSVGNLSSQFTYLIVFLVQAAIPILFLMVLQYIVGRRLATLVRESRENLRELERTRNRSLKNRRSLIQSVSDASFDPQSSNQHSVSKVTGGLPVIDSHSRADADASARPNDPQVKATSPSPSLNAKDLHDRLEKVQESPPPAQQNSCRQISCTASPGISTEKSSTLIPTIGSIEI